MATENPSSALRVPASSRPYPKANPGYGKRSMPGQLPRTGTEFDLLPERERYVAGFLEHLPEGAQMDIKTLAKQLPLYGQMAIGSALRALAAAGHLRHVRCPVGEHGQVRWVTRTFWTRTARDNEWWNTNLTADATPAATAETAVTPTAPAPCVPQQRTPEPAPSGHSPAYLALAQLGRTEPRLALSAADCAVLEPLATEWFARGVNTDYLAQALTAGLPTQVGSPIGFVRRRLNDKMPPHLPTAPSQAASITPAARPMVECAQCGAPGPSEALPDGLCRPCRQHTHNTAPAPAAPTVERDVKVHVDNLRELLRLP